MPPASSSKSAASSVAPPSSSSFSSSASSSASRASSELRELQSKFKKSLKTREYTSHSSKVHSVDWSCDGRRLASGSYDKTVCVFAMSQSDTKLSKETTFRGHSDSVDQARFIPNLSIHLLSDVRDLLLQVFSIRIISLQLCWHKTNSELLATASGDKTVRV